MEGHEKRSAAVSLYNRAVLVGNWYEEQRFAEEKLQHHLEKKASGQLYVQKRQRLFETVLEDRQVSCNRDGYVHYGDVVVIQHPGMAYDVPQHSQLLAAGLGENPLVTVPERLPPGEAVTCAYDLNPTVRTTFIISVGNFQILTEENCSITDENKAMHGKTLKFGEPFQLKTTEGVGSSLYLYSIRRTFLEFSKRTDHQCVKLVEDPSRYTSWCALHINPNIRLETAGFKVPTNRKIVINHMFTNKLMTLEWKYPFTTFFGIEYEVTTHTYLDPYQWPTSANHWIIREKAIEGTISKQLEKELLPTISQELPTNVQPDALENKHPICRNIYTSVESDQPFCPENYLLCEQTD